VAYRVRMNPSEHYPGDRSRRVDHCQVRQESELAMLFIGTLVGCEPNREGSSNGPTYA